MACTAPILLFFLFRRYRPVLYVHVACLCVAGVLGYLGYRSFWPEGRLAFVDDLYSIQKGMTRSEVEEIMGSYMTGTGWPAAPESSNAGTLTEVGSGAEYATTTSDSGELAIKDSIVYRWYDKDGDFDSDWGVVRFKDGKVVDVRFMMD